MVGDQAQARVGGYPVLRTYVGASTAAGPTVWVLLTPNTSTSPGWGDSSHAGGGGAEGSNQGEPVASAGYRYPLRWSAGAAHGWGSAPLARALLARALLADLCDASYRERTDLHRALASELLSELDQDRWELTQAALVHWLVEAHATSIWRRRAAVEAAPTEPWPWQMPAAG